MSWAGSSRWPSASTGNSGRPGFEQLLDQLAEEGADEAAKRHLAPNRVVAKGVQLRLLRQRVVMSAQKAQADVLLHRLHDALLGWDTAEERRGAQCEFRAAQPSQGRGLTATSMRTAALASTESAARPIRAGCAFPAGRRRRLHASLLPTFLCLACRPPPKKPLAEAGLENPQAHPERASPLLLACGGDPGVLALKLAEEFVRVHVPCTEAGAAVLAVRRACCKCPIEQAVTHAGLRGAARRTYQNRRICRALQGA
jgi:hypothetical protein